MVVSVRLDPLTPENRGRVIAVEVTDAQRPFLDTQDFAEFVADAPSYRTYRVHAICDSDTLVGFVSVGYTADDRLKWWIPLLIIDRRWQGKGYGRAAMLAIIQHVREVAPDCRTVGLSYKPENAIAERPWLRAVTRTRRKGRGGGLAQPLVM